MEHEGRLILSSDHAGFEMKEHVKAELSRLGIAFDDIGTAKPESTDYPIWAGRVAKAVSDGKYARGITICGTGLGASMAANKFKGVRAALCITEEMARLSKQHNNANVLVLGGRITRPDTASRILQTWLSTDFEGGRHQRRVDQIDEVNTGELE